MELLAPAGSADALRAAVQSGADAVYIGGTEFGARQSAVNFSSDEMRKWTDYCHLYGVDVHVTVNTLIKEKEIKALSEYVKSLNSIGVDALIVQDLGAAEIIKNTIPDMALHASTQMTVTSLEGARYLEKAGFSRVVLARELSEKEIEYISKNTRLETEVFVHGAICMCYSGQCLMSSILGGRSGNRGRCAQPCRLPYELLEGHKAVKSGYLLSPKDMALINELGNLQRIGVKSLKIEGRLKRYEYVAAVTGVYRKYLDMMEQGNGRRVSKEDMRILTDAFSRGGFTDGYFKNKLGRDMMSHKSPDGTKETKFTEDAKAAGNSSIRKIPISITGTLKTGYPLEVTFYDSHGHTGSAVGAVKPEKARITALDENRLKEQLLKLGSTPFVCDDIAVSVDEGITIPIKEINAARRAAADMLTEERIKMTKGCVTDYIIPAVRREKVNKIEITAEVYNEEQLRAVISGGIKIIYVPNKLLRTLNDKTLPEKATKRGIEIVAKASEILSDEEITTDAVLVSSPAAAYKYKTKRLYGDFRLNIYNSQAANLFRAFEVVTLSPELNLKEIANLLENTEVKAELIAYGRLPLMIMKNCPVKAAGKCQSGENIYKLRDRKKEEFPLVCAGGCRAVLLNSKPVYMADKAADLVKLKINSVRLIFTVEKFSQCGKIIDEYKRAFEGVNIKNGMPDNSYTRGHFYRGVL